MADIEEMSVDEEMSVVRELLLCPVCCNYMFAPIRQCRTGHSFCDQCFAKIKRCPECRAYKSDARSFKLEAISSKLKFSCKNSHLGCTYKDRGESITFHEKFCRFGVIVCPFKKYDTCDWYGYRVTLEAHCFKEHRKNFYCKQKQRFLAKNFSSITKDHYIYVLFHAYNEFFKLVWELDSSTNITKWVLMYMGSSENAKKFSYKITFPQLPDEEYHDISRDLTWISPCGTVPEDTNEKFSGHNYLMIHRNLLNQLCSPGGDLIYIVEIYKSRYCEGELLGETDSEQQADSDDDELNVDNTIILRPFDKNSESE